MTHFENLKEIALETNKSFAIKAESADKVHTVLFLSSGRKKVQQISINKSIDDKYKFLKNKIFNWNFIGYL